RKHRATFNRIGESVFLPLVALNLALMALETLAPNKLFFSLVKMQWLVSFVLVTFGSAVSAAACALVVEQLRAAPQKAVRLRPIFATLRQRFGALASTALAGDLATFVGLVKLVVPGARRFVDSSLFGP